MSNRRLTRAVRSLQKASEIKRIYCHADDVRVNDGNNSGTFSVMNLSKVPVVTPAGTTPIVREGRGQNTDKVLIKKFHIRFTMTATEGAASKSGNKYAVYLVRSELLDQQSYVRAPQLNEMFDNLADFAPMNKLKWQIDGFRNADSPAIDKVHILKKWTGTISPGEYLVQPPNPPGTSYTFPQGALYRPVNTVHHSTRQLDCEIEYLNSITTLQTKQGYFLLAVSDCSEVDGEFVTWNCVAATTFKDD